MRTPKIPVASRVRRSDTYRVRRGGIDASVPLHVRAQAESTGTDRAGVGDCGEEWGVVQPVLLAEPELAFGKAGSRLPHGLGDGCV